MKYRVDISRTLRVRQIVSTIVEADNEDQAEEIALRESEAGNLNWEDDQEDIPEPDDDSYVCEIEPAEEEA